jgi:hypothetical protein
VIRALGEGVVNVPERLWTVADETLFETLRTTADNVSLGNQTSCGGAREPMLHGVHSEYMDCYLLTGRDCTKIARRIAPASPEG